MKATTDQIREQANAVALTAEAIMRADNATEGEMRAFLARLKRNVEVLDAWMQD